MTEKEQVVHAQTISKIQEMLRENLPAYKEEFALKASICWIKYEALKKAGFNQFEALELCCKELKA